MNRFLIILFALFTAPLSAFAAHAPALFSIASLPISSNSSLGNVYTAGVSVILASPVGGDFSAIGGGITTAAAIAGDTLLFAGSINSHAPVGGDFRAFGGNISIEKPIGGDLVAFGFSAHDSGRPKGSVFMVALDSAVTDGASGPVIIYGNNVSLAGDFAGNVSIFASGRVSLSASTTIHGSLSYEAPEMAAIPASATIIGGIEYKNLSYLPSVGTSHVFALMSVWFFILARILGALILAGLLAGLFPHLAEAVASRAYNGNSRSILLTLLLGFAITVATPILLFILSLTLIGIGIALLVFVAYLLMLFLALIYAGILIGSMFVRAYARRKTVFWHDGVLGMLVLSLVALIPFVGMFIVFLLALFSAGSLLIIFFDFAFPHEEETPELI